MNLNFWLMRFETFWLTGFCLLWEILNILGGIVKSSSNSNSCLSKFSRLSSHSWNLKLIIIKYFNLHLNFYLFILKIPFSHTWLSTNNHWLPPTLTSSIDNFTAWQYFNFITTTQTLSIQMCWSVATWWKLWNKFHSRSTT